jgi:hypothetical protein
MYDEMTIEVTVIRDEEVIYALLNADKGYNVTVSSSSSST